MNSLQRLLCLLAIILTPAYADPLKSLVLYYDEAEAGVGVQTMRYIINDKFMRIDGGQVEQDFILFDRQKKTVYSINHEDQTILKIINKPWNIPEFSFEVNTKITELTDAPRVFDQPVYDYSVTADKEVCTRVMLVKNMYMNELAVLHEYQTIMSGQQVATLGNTPEELQTPCFLVDQVFHKADYFKLGLPIQLTYSRDYSKQLKTIKPESFDRGLFSLPQGYKEYLPFYQ